jgi:hypothetical protein
MFAATVWLFVAAEVDCDDRRAIGAEVDCGGEATRRHKRQL